jgi:AhpC/TSA family
VATAKGHAPGHQRITIGTAVPQVEITLGRSRAFTGRVVDIDGKPIGGAFVNPGVWRGYRCMGSFLWTDADGRFRWENAPNDELIVNVQRQGYVGVFQQHVAPDSADVVFKLDPCLSVRGTVRDAETNRRVENAALDFGAIDPQTGNVPRWTSPPRLGLSTGVLLGSLDVNLPVTAEAYKIRIQSPGYQTFISRTIRREEKAVVDYDVALVPGTTKPAGAVATVLRSDGKPLAGARVYSTPRAEGFNVDDGVVRGRGGHGREDRTGPDGTFALPQIDRPWFVLILGDDACAYASSEELEKESKIEAKPYGRIEGRCLIGNRPISNQELEMDGILANHSTRNCNVILTQKTKTDELGRFTFKSVIPTRSLRIRRVDRKDFARGVWSIGDPVGVEPGATAQVMLGGKGRPVIGRVEPPSGWTKPIDFTDRSEAHIESDRPFTPYPLSLFRGKISLAGSELTAWNERWRESAEGHDDADLRVSIGIGLAPDGSFRIDDVPAGEYRLAIRVNGESIHHITVQYKRNSGPFAHIIRVFTVSPVPNGRSDEPIDVGVLRLTPRVTLKAGEPAPAFKVTTVDGRKLSVPEDFRGKFLLIDFATLWDIAAPHQITLLNEVNQNFGKDTRFAILSLTMAADNAPTRKSIEDKGELWPQAIVGPLSNPIASAYGVDYENVSTATLIGPDGTIVATELWRDKIRDAIAKALGNGEK